MTPEQLDRIFHERIAPVFFAGARSDHAPVLILLGGQPGAGKSRAADALLDAHASHDVTPIVGDDFRSYHPGYGQAMLNDPTGMPDLTAVAAGRWTGMAVEHCLTRGYSLLIEGTWRNAVTAVTTLERAKDLGYRTHAAIVAVPAVLSLVGTLTRYYDDPDTGNARWTPVAAHQNTIAALPNSVAAIAGSPLVDRFTITNRDGEILFDDATTARLATRSARAGAVYGVATDRDLTDAELAALIIHVTRVLQLHEARTPHDARALAAWAELGRILHGMPDTAPLRKLQGRVAALPGLDPPDPVPNDPAAQQQDPDSIRNDRLLPDP